MRRLLEGPIDSFEKLELVLAVLRADTPQTVASLGRMLNLDANGVRPILGELVRSQIVAIESRDPEGTAPEIVRIASRPEHRAALDRLAKLYEEDRVLVMATISRIALERIRGMAARTFADAFRVRKRDSDDD